MLKIVIVPIERVDADATRFIQNGLKKVFPSSEVAFLETAMPIPKEAYDSSRQQYHSTHILAKISGHVGRVEGKHVLGVTEVDLYSSSLNFVFGEAECPGKAALVSLFRLRPEFYGEPSERQLFYERALKEAVHEIGHTLGLGHCKNPVCVMYFSNSIRDTDRKRAEFCEKYRQSVT